jgi:DNA-binding transcriptional MocR family regulator/CheY-like chemotaxis protein
VSSRSRARVLIVDDDEAVRLALRLVLDEHHDVLEAGDGGTALDLVDGGRVDVVVLDLLLPNTDGFEVLQHLRTLPRRVPVVVLSALNTSWTAATAMRLGAVDYITKPFDDAQVLTAVAEGLDAIRGDEASGAPARRASRVLCVGIPIGVRATLSILLEGHGHVDAAPDVSAALARLDVTRPDAVVVDVSEETLRTHGEPISRLRRHFAGELALLRRPGSVGALLGELAASMAGHADRWSRFSEVTRRTLDDLAEHYQDATVERLGQTMRVAPYALSARFRREVGTPLRTYLQTLRIEIAKALLIETSDSVAAVAARVGWHDASHLSRIFTAHVGCRPGVYRRRHGRPRSSVVDPPLVTPIDERVAFDVAECTGELRPPAVFTAMMEGASRDVERLGPAAAGMPIAAFSEAVGAYLIERGVTASRGVVLTTSGTSTSLAILARALASVGEVVAVEQPTRRVALAAFAAAGLRVLGIPVDGEGLRVDLLEAALRHYRVPFVYVQPSVQNPTGVSLSAARRLELLALARSFDTLIVEDDAAAELAYEEIPPPLRTEEGTERVIYLKSFSKLLGQALRVAVMVAPRACAEALKAAQHGLAPVPSALAQSVVARCLPTPELRHHLERVRRLLDARWQVMSGALETRMPEGVRWTLSRGGASTWLDLPAPLTAPELLADAAKLGVDFAPGALFCVDGSGRRGARLAFGATPPPAIERGVRHLARAIRERLRAPLVDATTVP